MIILAPEDADLPSSDATHSLPVGRGPFNGLVIEHPNVSISHALFCWRDGHWQVQDLRSTQGTRLNGKPVQGWTRVKSGASVAFGPVEYRVVALEKPIGDADDALAGLNATAGLDAGRVRLRLRRVGEGGAVTLLHRGEQRHLDMGQRFDLLLALAEARVRDGTPDGGRLDNDDLRRAVWGGLHGNKSDGVLYKAVFDTRTALQTLGFSRSVIQKTSGCTWLDIPPDRLTLT